MRRFRGLLLAGIADGLSGLLARVSAIVGIVARRRFSGVLGSVVAGEVVVFDQHLRVGFVRRMRRDHRGPVIVLRLDGHGPLFVLRSGSALAAAHMVFGRRDGAVEQHARVLGYVGAA